MLDYAIILKSRVQGRDTRVHVSGNADYVISVARAIAQRNIAYPRSLERFEPEFTRFEARPRDDNANSHSLAAADVIGDVMRTRVFFFFFFFFYERP